MKKAPSKASLPAGSRRKKWVIQGFSFALFLLLFASMHYPWRSWIPYRLFLDLDPLHSLAALSGTRQFYLLATDSASSTASRGKFEAHPVLRLAAASDKIYLPILIEGYRVVHPGP